MGGQDVIKLAMTIGIAVIVVAAVIWYVFQINIMNGDAWGQVGRQISSFNLFG